MPKPSTGTLLFAAALTVFLGGLGALAYARHKASQVAPPPVQAVRDPAETARELSVQMQDILSAKNKESDVALLLPDAKKLADANPGCFEAQLLLGQLYMAKKNYALAYAPVHAALELRPLGQELTKLLGTLAANTDRPQDAEALYRRALEKAVRGHDRAMVHAMLGALLRSEGKLDEAGAEFSAALEDEASLAVAQIYRADLAVVRGRLDDALTFAEEGEAWAESTRGSAAPFLLIKARILLARGNADEAYRLILTQIPAKERLTLTAASVLAQIFEKQGKPGKAAAHYDAVVAELEAPPPPDAKPDLADTAAKEEALTTAKEEAAKWWKKAQAQGQS